MDSKCNKLKIMVAMLLLPLFHFSQQSIIEEIANKKISIKTDEIAATNKILSVKFGENIFFTPQNNYSASKNRTIYKYNISSGTIDSLKILYSKETKSFINERFFSFEITEDKIIILTDPSVIVLSYNKSKTTYISSLKNKYFFNYIKKLNNNEFFLYVNYNFHPLDAADKHVWAKYNIQTNTINSIKKMDEKNTIFTHFVNNWVSIYNGLIAYSNTTEYKINFYDEQFTRVDSISLNKLDSNDIYLNEINLNNNYSKDGITEIMKKDEVSLKRIQKIFLMDSTHLMVMLKLPKTRKCEFDLWVKNNNVWKLNNSEIISNFYEQGKSYKNKNQISEGFFGNVNGIIYNKNFVFNILYFPFLENIVTESFNYNNDYENKINNLVKNKELYYGIRTYKINYK